MNSSVVITGIGAVNPAGLGLDPLRAALSGAEGQPTVVDRSAGFHRAGGALCASQLGPSPYGSWLSPRDARRMSPASRMAVCAARMAVDDAGLAAQDVAGEDTAVSIGTSFGSTNYASLLLQQVHDQGPLSISPLLFMETVANAHAGQVALACGATGSNVTLSQREASGLLAVARARDLICAGRAKRVLAGSVDEVSPILHAMLDRFGALARATQAEDAEVARPFDERRSGFVLAEGGTVLMLEEQQVAERRGAQVRGRIVASARASDPTASASDWGHGHEELARRLVQRLETQGITLDSIDRVVSGASGARRGDRLEAHVLRAAFGSALPPVLAPKSVIGEYGGGFLACAVLALETECWSRTTGFEQVDPELGLTPFLGEALVAPRRILVTSLASGGAACWLVIDSGADL